MPLIIIRGKETAKNPLLPSINADATGPLTRWSAACEQYLDSSPASIIAPQTRQDRTSLAGTNLTSAHSVNPAMARIERMASGLVRITLKSRGHGTDQAESPPTSHEMLVGGLAAQAWEEPPVIGILSRYCPASWHHPHGIRKILRKLVSRLPDVSGALFLTLTHDRTQFASPASAYDVGRPHIRKVMAHLRKGVMWKGKFYQIDSPYCVKLEFHADEDGWPHYHLIILTRSYLPADLVSELWGFGFCKVRRINNHKFHYLLKYVTKGGGYPEWVKSRSRLRIFQPSHGFMLPSDRPQRAPLPKPDDSFATIGRRQRASFTIGERLNRWERMALLNCAGKFETLLLAQPFQELFDLHIFTIAEDKRYLGNGFIKINTRKEILQWKIITNQN